MNDMRLKRVRALMRRQRLEQLIVTQPQSIYYLTGEWVAPLDRLDALIITADDVRMLCYNLAVIEPAHCRTVIYDDMGRALPCLMELMERAPACSPGCRWSPLARTPPSRMPRPALTGLSPATP